MNPLLRKLFPSLTWNFSSQEKTLFLTFDDGPIPEVTPWVLETLDKYKADATFFCVGNNAVKNPEIFKMLTESRHSIGNHTMQHRNGWKTPDRFYFEDVYECSQYVKSDLFRPPYGKIKPGQTRKLKKDFRIIMWDVLSKDYKKSLTGMQCFENVKQKAKSGSIIVFHDSLKAEERLRIALPATLKYFSEEGFKFSAIRS